MRRRDFIAGITGLSAAWPLAARAQQPDGVRQIGVLMGYAESDSDAQARVAAFRDGLQKLGWAEGRNIRIDTRWPIPADLESMQRFAKELVALRPNAILSHITPTTAALLIRDARTAISALRSALRSKSSLESRRVRHSINPQPCTYQEIRAPGLTVLRTLSLCTRCHQYPGAAWATL